MPPIPARRPFHRPAFALNGWILTLFLLLVALLAWRSYMLWSNLPANPATLYGHTNAALMGMKIGIWLAPVIAPLITLGIAWLVGWGVSKMFGKSDDAGNIGAALIFVLVLGLFGFSAYSMVTAPPPPQNVAAAIQPAPAEPDQTLRRAGALTDQQAAAARDAAQRQLDALRSTPPSARIDPPRPSMPARPPTAAPSRPASATPPSTAPAPATPPVRPTANPAIRPVIDEYEKELNGQIDSLAEKFARLAPELARAPAHDMTKIKERNAATDVLKTEAEALRTTLDRAVRTLSMKLENVGIPDSDAHFAAFQWVHMDFKDATRGFGADAIVRLCEKSAEECAYLTDNFGKWTLDSKGEVKSSEISIKQQAGSKRFFVKTDAQRKDDILDQLTGKR